MRPKKLILRSLLVLALLVFISIEWGFYHHHNKVVATFGGFVEESLAKEKFDASILIKQLERDGLYKRLYKRNILFTRRADDPVSAASLIKVPLMAAVFMADREGSLDLSAAYTLKNSDHTAGSGLLKAVKAGTAYTYLELVELMVSKSDNTASNILIKKLGFDYLNLSFARLGLKNTAINRLVMDLESRKKGIDNLVSASDLGLLFEKIYRGQLIDQDASLRMLEFLSKQKVNDRIPRYLPKSVTIAHKTGTIRGIVHDAGIVLANDEDYLLCVLTEGSQDYQSPKDFIARISEFVYYTLVYGN
ncbi:serine hydrolase [Candidatus Omnitrophota bacterium]